MARANRLLKQEPAVTYLLASTRLLAITNAPPDESASIEHITHIDGVLSPLGSVTGVARIGLNSMYFAVPASARNEIDWSILACDCVSHVMALGNKTDPPLSMPI